MRASSVSIDMPNPSYASVAVTLAYDPLPKIRLIGLFLRVCSMIGGPTLLQAPRSDHVRAQT
jgi:hypothetical protein